MRTPRAFPLLLLAAALCAPALCAQQQNLSMVVRPFVHPDGHTIDLSLAANWGFAQGAPMPFNSAGRINTQFQTWNGVPLVVGSTSSSTRQFQRQSVPFVGRTPFVGGLFRNQWQATQTRHSDFTFRATLVDPAGNPLHAPGTQPFERLPAPPMVGFVK